MVHLLEQETAAQGEGRVSLTYSADVKVTLHKSPETAPERLLSREAVKLDRFVLKLNFTEI